jgi:fructose-1,6-bisphosphatase/inositol monophosphatase family enzyme
MKKTLLLIGLVVIGYGLFTLGDIRGTANFKNKIDSLSRENQLHQTVIDSINIVQDSHKVRDSILTYQAEHQKAKVIKIREYVEVEVNRIDNLTEQEIVTHLNQRYPKDTITNPLPIAQPVLVSVSKDLAAYDGVKQELVIKDSIITIQDNRITLKDSTIGLYVNKEVRFKSIISNQDLKINEWSKQYNNLMLDYNKMKVKNKITRIGTGIIIGGLIFMTVAK